MADIGSVLQQVSMIGGALASAVGQVTGRPVTVPGYGAPPYGPSSYGPSSYGYAPPVPTDSYAPGAPSAIPALPPVSSSAPAAQPPASTGSGFMAALASLWQGIVGFFKRLFGGSSAVASGPNAPAAPASSSDARSQAFAMFPTGHGTALGFVPVSVQRTPSALIASAAGFGQFAAFWQNGQLYVQQGSGTPQLVTAMTSARQADGSTLFAATLQDGKSASFDVSADGHTLSCKGYSVTLA